MLSFFTITSTTIILSSHFRALFLHLIMAPLHHSCVIPILLILGIIYSSALSASSQVSSSSSPSIQEQNSLFLIESNTVYTTQSTWLSTFLIDFSPYFQFTNQISENLHGLAMMIKFYLKKTTETKNSPMKSSIQTHIQLSGDRLKVFHNKVEELEYIIRNIRMLTIRNNKPNYRQKRALFSFLGDLLSGITGVATKKDIRAINDKLREVSSLNLDLIHVVEDSMSIVNATRIKLSETIGTVNSLVNVTDRLVKHLSNITASLASDIKALENFNTHWHQIALYFDVVQDIVTTAFRKFMALHVQVSDILNHKLTPNVISPMELRRILKEVSQTISSSLSLPYDPDYDIMSYYKHLRCSLVLHENGIMVVLAIPLLSEHSKFTMYDVINVPVPHPSDDMSIVYDIPFDKFALSEDKK